ncbi:ArgE/DapE family deacylase [Pseudonocardia kujensis]|uniref:M20 family metallopeptidase n=1 Tax=Pseudonocardia kujensis TaxID=1128675 RepID=UPI001E488146|nr:ArgE/DapE family deacylase [Pseudonocardia kujensis]MCE0768083.1 ArgE/DapE family deacylase [Pseudonocardia kujensis]
MSPAENSVDVTRLMAAVDALREPMTASLRDLVRIPSVSPKYPGIDYRDHVGRESDATALVADLYRRAGATVDTFSVEDGRANAVGRLGRGRGRSLIFNGHVDVVPPGDATEWTVAAPFSGDVVDRRMYGRGTTDQKSGLVAQAWAAIALREAGVELDGELQLQCVVGEETGDHACGTGAVLERGFTAEAAVVSEPSAPPTPLSVVLGSPGLLWFAVSVTGKKVHSSMRGDTIHSTGPGAAIGVNAIDKMFLVYQGLRALEDEWAATQRHPLWPRGHFSLLPGAMRGGPGGLTVPFSLSDSATIEYAVEFHPERSVADVQAEIQAAVDRVADGDPWLRHARPHLEWKLDWDPFLMSADADISQSLAAAYRTAATGSRFPTDVSWTGFYGVCDGTVLTRGGVPSLVFGPGDLRVAHGNDEYVDLDEVWLAARTFALLAAQWCGGRGPVPGSSLEGSLS